MRAFIACCVCVLLTGCETRVAITDAAIDVARTDAIDVSTTRDAADTGPADVVQNDAIPDAGSVCVRRDIPGLERRTQGRFVVFPAFPSQRSGTRTVTVYLPSGNGPFPVLYANDGQNLFDPTRAAFGTEWGVDEAAQALETEGTRVIIVGIDNTAQRTTEYTPVSDPQYGGGGGDQYLDFVVNELKPFIDANFPTRCERDGTAMMGSSLGGLISLHAARRYGDVFGGIAALSPSLWWNNRSILDDIRLRPWASSPRLWIDAGTDEGSVRADGTTEMIDNLRTLRDVMLTRGYMFATTLGYLEEPRMPHNEFAWSRRVGSVLRFLFAPRNVAPRAGFVWAYRNPLGISASTHAVLEVILSDGVEMTVPPAQTSWNTTGGTARWDPATYQLTGLSSGDTTLRARWSGLDLNGTIRVATNPASENEILFDVDVPATTPMAGPVAVVGEPMALRAWDPVGVSMLAWGTNRWRTSVLVPATANIAYKYTRGSWANVEVNAAGADISNRTESITGPSLFVDRVERWHDQ